MRKDKKKAYRENWFSSIPFSLHHQLEKKVSYFITTPRIIRNNNANQVPTSRYPEQTTKLKFRSIELAAPSGLTALHFDTESRILGILPPGWYRAGIKFAAGSNPDQNEERHGITYHVSHPEWFRHIFNPLNPSPSLVRGDHPTIAVKSVESCGISVYHPEGKFFFVHLGRATK